MDRTLVVINTVSVCFDTISIRGLVKLAVALVSVVPWVFIHTVRVIRRSAVTVIVTRLSVSRPAALSCMGSTNGRIELLEIGHLENVTLGVLVVVLFDHGRILFEHLCRGSRVAWVQQSLSLFVPRSTTVVVELHKLRAFDVVGDILE